MVLTYVAHKFKPPGCSLCAVHINYNNRNCTSDEVAFVQDYCNSFNPPILLDVLHINDITRSRNNTREYYEEYTRMLRFDHYSRQHCPVLLGHNYEDTLENIISNISSLKNYDNLKKMVFMGEERGVTIVRPMLQVSKADIYNYAEHHKISHLPDSTPKWSRRGKLRDHVIPTLLQYEPNFLKNLVVLAEDVQKNYEHIANHPDSVVLPDSFLNTKQRVTNKQIAQFVRQSSV